MNCQRTQSLLSAFLDGELTGEDMLLVRSHVFSCDTCHEEFVSLQVVKRLLGSLDSVEADNDWQKTVTTHAFAGTRHWWELKVALEPSGLFFESIGGEHSLTPRGLRMARVLALSAVVVLLAASPFARYDHAVVSSQSTVAAGMGMGMPLRVWPLHTERAASFTNLPFPIDMRPTEVQQGYTGQYPADFRQVSDVLRGWQQPIAGSNSLTLTVSDGN